MPIIPLGTKAYRRADAFVPETRLVNMYLEADDSGISPDKTMRITRPGLALQTTLDGVTRSLHYRTATGQVLAVAGSALYVDNTPVGSVGGLGIVPNVSTTFVHAMVGGQTLYLYDTAVTALATPDDPFTGEPQYVQDVDQLNQYVLVLMTNGRFYWIEPGETAFDPLNFATAESSPDAGIGICRIGDEFWIFGAETIEPWQSTGDLDAPFQRVSGRLYERGCRARDAVCRFDNSVIWVADDCQVCRGGAVPQVVSDNGLAERIRKATGEVSAWVFGFDGHEFYALRIPGQGTFCYDAQTQSWCEFATMRRTEWAPHVGYDIGGRVLAGDVASGDVWELSPLGDDAGLDIEWTVTGTVSLMGRTPRNNSISVGVGCAAPGAVVRVRWRDGQDDYPAYYDELDARAPFDVCAIYRLGQPLQPYREVEFSGTTRVRIAGAMANDAWR